MSTWRSPRALVAAALAAVVAYAFVAAHGAPAPLAWLASRGQRTVDARGGVVLDVRFASNDERLVRASERTLIARLAAQGATVEVEHPGPSTVRLSAAGVRPEGAAALAASLQMRGRLALRPVRVRGPRLDEIAALRGRLDGTRVEVATDAWTAADGARHDVPYLRAPDRASLEAALRDRLAPGDDVVIEEAAAGARYRTYVVAPDVIIDNDDIAGAVAEPDPNTEGAVVMLTFTPSGGQRFGDWTAAHIGDKLAIIVDGQVRSAPIIQSAIRGGKAMITMGDAATDAWAEAHALAGALAARAPLVLDDEVRVVAAFEPSPLAAHLARLLAGLLAALLALALAWGVGRAGRLEAAPPGRVAIDASTGAIRWAALAGRAAITIGVPVALIFLRDVWVPGVDRDALAALSERGRDPTAWVSFGMLGVTPILTAYVIVELIALAIPGWRARRHAGRDARVPLAAAAAGLAAALTIVQAWLVASYLARLAPALGEIDRWPVVASLSAGVLAQALAAAAISRWGAGGGWSVLLGASYLEPIVRAIAGGHARAAPLALWLAEGALVAWIVILAIRARIRDRERDAAVRLPLAGVAAVAIAPGVLAAGAAVLMFAPPFELVFDGAAVLAHLGEPVVQLIAAPVLGLGLGALWSRRLGGRARATAVVLSAAIATAIAGLQALPWLAHLGGPGLGVAFAAAALIDLGVELRARARGAWIERDQLHDVDAADAALAAPGGDRFARGLYARAMFRFFAPFLPITIFERG